MGRPLHKRNFGPPTPDGKEIKTNFHNGTTVVEGYIVKQLGSKKFRVAELGAQGELVTYDRFLTDTAIVVEGQQMTITVKGDDNEVYLVNKISAHKVYVTSPNTFGSNALDNTSITWNYTVDAADKAVQIEEAGDDNRNKGSNNRDDTDFVEIDPDA